MNYKLIAAAFAYASLACMFIGSISFIAAKLIPVGPDSTNQKAVNKAKRIGIGILDFSMNLLDIAIMIWLYEISPWIFAAVFILRLIYHFWGSKMPIFLLLLVPTLMSAQSKTSEVKAYLGERYNTIAAPGNWDFYFQTVTIIRKSDGTKTFPQLLASASNWSDAPDGKLEQIRCNGKLYTDMRKQQAQTEKPAIKTRMVSNYVGKIDSMQIAEQIDRAVKEGPGWIAGIWNSWWFNSLAILFMFALSTLYFLSKACLNEVKINNAGIVTFGRWMYIFGCWVAGIQWFVALFACTFLLVTFMALVISGTWEAFFFSWSVWSLAFTGIVFKVIVSYTLALFDKLTPEPPDAINRGALNLTINQQGALPTGGKQFR